METCCVACRVLQHISEDSYIYLNLTNPCLRNGRRGIICSTYTFLSPSMQTAGMALRVHYTLIDRERSNGRDEFNYGVNWSVCLIVLYRSVQIYDSLIYQIQILDSTIDTRRCRRQKKWNWICQLIEILCRGASNLWVEGCLCIKFSPH